MSTRTGVERARPSTLWRLARPAGMPLVLGLPLVGYGFGHWEWGLTARSPSSVPWLLAAWWLLSAGTLWLNAALDRDDGDVLMGRAVPVPGDIESWAYGALVGAVLCGLAAGWGTGLCAAGCAGLAVAYSHPRLAWKGHPILGPAVNVVGYGLLSPLAGWLLVGTEPTRRTLPALVLLACWIAGTYFGAQAFQGAEDRRRGYRTLVATHGAATTVALARIGFAVGLWGAVALAVVGWFPRALVVGVLPWIALDRHLARWQRDGDPADGAERGRVMLKRAVVVALTVLGAVTVQHIGVLLAGGQPAGLGTAWSPWP